MCVWVTVRNDIVSENKCLSVRMIQTNGVFFTMFHDCFMFESRKILSSSPEKLKKNHFFLLSPRFRRSIKNVYRNQLVGLFSDVNIRMELVSIHKFLIFLLFCGMRKKKTDWVKKFFAVATHSRRLFFSLKTMTSCQRKSTVVVVVAKCKS